MRSSDFDLRTYHRRAVDSLLATCSEEDPVLTFRALCLNVLTLHYLVFENDFLLIVGCNYLEIKDRSFYKCIGQSLVWSCLQV